MSLQGGAFVDYVGLSEPLSQAYQFSRREETTTTTTTTTTMGELGPTTLGTMPASELYPIQESPPISKRVKQKVDPLRLDKIIQEREVKPKNFESPRSSSSPHIQSRKNSDSAGFPFRSSRSPRGRSRKYSQASVDSKNSPSSTSSTEQSSPHFVHTPRSVPNSPHQKDKRRTSSFSKVLDYVGYSKYQTKSLYQCILKKWSKLPESEKPKISPSIIEKHTLGFTEAELIELYNLNIASDDDLLVRSEMIWQEILPRYSAMLKLVEDHSSKESSTIQSYLKRLLEVKVEGDRAYKDIASFIVIIDEILQLDDDKEELKECLLAPLGNDQNDITAVIAVLRGFSEPKQLFMYQLSHLKHILNQLGEECKNVPQYHRVTFQYPIKEFTVDDFHRGLFADDSRIIHDKFVVNGIEISNEDGELIFPTKQEVNRQNVYESLFLALLGAKADYKSAAKAFIDNLDKKSTDSTKIPCIELLKASTFNAWSNCDAFLRELYPDLFIDPYWTRYEHKEGPEDCGTKSYISTNPPEVVQIRPLFVCNYRKRTENRLRINLAWKLEPYHDLWIGTCWIQSYDILNKEHWGTLKPILANPKALSENHKDDKGIIFEKRIF